jgi:hypothetical protein
MTNPVDSIPHSSSDATAKGKGPADKAVYLPDLPLDIRNLIFPYLFDHETAAQARDRNASVASTRDALSKELTTPIVDKCRGTLETISLYREIALDKGEHLPNPENLEETLKYLRNYNVSVFYDNIRNSIVKGQFTTTVTPSTFKYANERIQKYGMTTEYRDGYTAARHHTRDAIHFIPTALKGSSGGSLFTLFTFPIRDFALAPTGILFVATDHFLEIYDLTQPTLYLGSTLSNATRLHQLDYQFDRITWDIKRACLIGEKEGQVTELKFEPSAPEAPPKAKPRMSSIAKMGYVAKRILKIIVVEGPENAFKGTKQGFELLSLSKRKLIVTAGLGALGGGLFAAGFALCVLAPPIFAILAVPACTIGAGLIGWAISPLILPSIFGTITGIVDTFSSLNDLRREVFSS